LSPMRIRLVVLATTAAVIAAALAIAGGSAGAASACVNLKVTAGVKPALKAAYFAIHHRHSPGPTPGTTFYGRCGTTLYAAADMPDPRFAETDDQPESFRKLAGHVWHDIGDDGSLCTIPKSLRLGLWHLRGPC